jgi:CxxC-x17-CxxC domain-containing protein
MNGPVQKAAQPRRTAAGTSRSATRGWPQKSMPLLEVCCVQRILVRIHLFGLYNAETRRTMAGDMQITCSDCGQEFTFSAADQQFFQERGYSTPKRCKPCRMAKKNEQGGSGYRSAPSQGTPVICSGCGQPTTVPFEPRGDRPVYCRDCYTARKGSGGGSRARA